MDQTEDKSCIITFRKDVEELKIPANLGALPVDAKNTIEFIVETD